MLTPATDQHWTPAAAAHLLHRAAFGGSPDDIQRLHARGLSAAVASLLEAAPDTRFPLPEWAQPAARAEEAREILEARRTAMAGGDETARADANRRALQNVQRRNREHAISLIGWWFRRMTDSTDPLREKMALFWHGHFATSIEKVKSPAFMLQQNELFRRQGLGSVQALTKDIATDPAMMIYLDTAQSNRRKPNENFARELMELFTLGEGHYTEDDIRESARAFTGWRVRQYDLAAEYNPQQHDDGTKTFFGRTGAFEGTDIVDLIFQQPQCARFLCRKLWRFFVSDRPDDAAVDALATVLRANGYQIKPVLHALFTSAEFYAPGVMRQQIKSPVQFLVQMKRELEITAPIPDRLLSGILDQLGQVLFRPPNVAGWEGGKTWITTSTLLSRYNIAGFATTGADPGIAAPNRGGGAAAKAMIQRATNRAVADAGRRLQPDWSRLVPPALRLDADKLVATLCQRFLHGPLTPADQGKVTAFLTSRIRPEGVSDDVLADLTHLILSTPSYQLC